jgi:hypothetical protein
MPGIEASTQTIIRLDAKSKTCMALLEAGAVTKMVVTEGPVDVPVAVLLVDVMLDISTTTVETLVIMPGGVLVVTGAEV